MSTGTGRKGGIAAALLGVMGIGAWDAWTHGSLFYRQMMGDAWVNPKARIELGVQVFFAASCAVIALWGLTRLHRDAGRTGTGLLAYFCVGTLAIKAMGWLLYR